MFRKITRKPSYPPAVAVAYKITGRTITVVSGTPGMYFGPRFFGARMFGNRFFG